MSDNLVSALLGLVGGLLGGFIGYIATIRASKQQLAAMERQAERDRIEREEDKRARTRDNVILLMADFLTEHTVRRAKHDPDMLNDIDHQLERMVKNFHMQGEHDLASELFRKGQDYLMALKLYARDGLSSEELHRRRIRARNEIEEVMLSLTRGDYLIQR
jgi:hypothetical protein